jgi:hypothetical protein
MNNLELKIEQHFHLTLVCYYYYLFIVTRKQTTKICFYTVGKHFLHFCRQSSASKYFLEKVPNDQMSCVMHKDGWLTYIFLYSVVRDVRFVEIVPFS